MRVDIRYSDWHVCGRKVGGHKHSCGYCVCVLRSGVEDGAKIRAMSNTTTPTADELFEAAPTEAGALKNLDNQIEQIYGQHGSARLLDAEGNAIEIPASALRAFRLVVRRMAHGEKLALLTHGNELTTQQAAELLNVSRPHLIKLLRRTRSPSIRSARTVGWRPQTCSPIAQSEMRSAMKSSMSLSAWARRCRAAIGRQAVLQHKRAYALAS